MATVTGSALNAVIRSLLDLFTQDAAFANTTVYDGAPVTEAGIVTMVTIGDDADPDSEAGNTFAQTPVDLAQTRVLETGEVVCAVVANSGQTNLSAQRENAFTLMSAVNTVVRRDMTLGGVVMEATVTTGSMRSFQNSAGSAIVIPFVVRYMVII